MSKHPHITPKPLFDTIANIEDNAERIQQYLDNLKITNTNKEYQLSIEFLKSYANSPDTYTSYRREVEKLLHWSWLIAKKPVAELKRNDIRDFLTFVQNPPTSWVSTKIISRFLTNADGLRTPNPEWRPFVVKVSKTARKQGKEPNKEQHQFSNKSIEAIFAVLSSFFTYLQQEDYLDSNPVALIRQKKGYIQREQTRKVTRKLSNTQWQYVITTAKNMASEDSKHQRTLFMTAAFYLLGLRISELAHHSEHAATMGNFAPDKRGLWWYTTIGKGNKIRDVAVPDELLEVLKSYRESLNLTPLPARGEQTPLLPKLKGRQGLGARQIRNVMQSVFDQAIEKMRTSGKIDEANDLETATVHWLRHTAISSDVEFRPREHIRDDVGHENPATMDKYIDTDRIARHKSAQLKKLEPEETTHEND